MKQKSDGTAQAKVVLRLYVTGNSPKSVAARANLDVVCKTYLGDRAEVELIDVFEDPLRMLSDAVAATPSLVRVWPEPEVRTVGDLSDHQQLLLLLGLPTLPP